MCIIFLLTMERDIYLEAEILQKIIQNDPRIKKLNELEKKMEEDKEVILLAYQKDVATTEYSDILNIYDRENEIAKKYQHKLYLAKKALDEHPLVQQYLKAYKEVRELYSSINEILFSDLSIELCPKEK